MTGPAIQLDNPFWWFSLAVYSQPGVAEACLRLQSERGMDVNLLLLCCWLGADRGIVLDGADLEAAVDVVGTWHARVVVPLRRARTDIKAMPLIEVPAIGRVRETIKAVELEAEQIEQALLYGWAIARWPAQTAGTQEAVTQNLCLLLARDGAGATPAVASPQLAALIAASMRQCSGPAI
jgi:uncharacterized protein (TIGR02444 family)